MQRGEVVTVSVIVAISAVLLIMRTWEVLKPKEPDPGIPFYSTASTDLKQRAAKLIDNLQCKSCHKLWGRSMMEMTMNVPAPRLDGIGSLRSEKWFYNYFSAKNPQAILPSRLKPEFRMPSYLYLPDADRRALASYMSSLKVENWYLQETKKAEYEVLTGKSYQASQDQARE
jgi:sulfur-oxidizing protein SoxX